jgi:hypothetical protein
LTKGNVLEGQFLSKARAVKIFIHEHCQVFLQEPLASGPVCFNARQKNKGKSM